MRLQVLDDARGWLRIAADSWHASGDVTSFAGQGDPVLLLHGFGGTPRMLRPLSHSLRRALGRPTLDLGLGIGLRDIRASAIVAHRLLESRGVWGCDVIGYSMGGLVALYLLKCLDQGRRIRCLVTIGTPHAGVPFLSRWPELVTRFLRSATQMRRGSPFLEELLRVPPPAGVRIVSIAGGNDSLVPPEATRLDEPESRNLVVAEVDHLGLLTSRAVFRCVEDLLDSIPLRRPPSAAIGLW
jgi:pimeloyl-ACP methyl ester carboxylesterase